jgi:hypothetical protein
MMKILFFSIIVIVGFLGGCGSAKRVVVAEKTLPLWYEHPPHATLKELYGVGEGKSKREAIDNALALIASTLSVSISSQYNAKTVIKEGSVNSSEATYINQTQSSVKKIRITNYTLLNAAVLGFKHYAVLVKVDKGELFRGLKNEIDANFAKIALQEQSIKKANALEQLAFYKRALQKIQTLQNSLAVMKVLKEDFDADAYLKKQNRIENEYNRLLASIHFSIKTTADAKRFLNAVEAGITKEHFAISNKSDFYHFVIYISAKIEKAHAYGFDIVRGEIRFSTKDAKGNLLGENLLHINGQSSQGYAVALQDLSKKFHQEIAKKGIFKILNLNIY